mgnify:CR=1 FL=1
MPFAYSKLKKGFLVILFPIIIIIILIFTYVSLHNLSNLIQPDIRECLHVNIEEPLISGHRITVTLSCESDVYDLDNLEVMLYYSNDNTSFLTKKLSIQNNKLSVKVETKLNQENFYYYFFLNYNHEGNKRYPEYGVFISTFEPEYLVIVEPDIKHKQISYNEIRDQKEVIINIYINDKFPVGDVTLFYKFNDDINYANKKMTFLNSYETNVTIPNNAKSMQYYIDIETIKTHLKYPEENFILVKNPKIEAIKAQLLYYAYEQHINLYLGFDDLSGNIISINSNDGISGLSTIKLYIMLEVYRQIDLGIIKKTDIISRYGYYGTVDNALRQMMIYSNNAAAGALILKVGGVNNINKTLRMYLGNNSKSILFYSPGYIENNVIDPSVIGNNTITGYNTLTADDQIKILKMLYRGKILTNYSQEMISLMSECKDYFHIRNLPGLKNIAMKTGYYPPIKYGLIGIVETTNGNNYVFSIHIENKNNESVKITSIKDILRILQKYYE